MIMIMSFLVKTSLCTLSEEFDYIQFRKSDLPLDIYLIKG